MESNQTTGGLGTDMLASLFGLSNLEEAHAKGRAELEAASEQLRKSILAVDPLAVLGYLWGQLLMGRMGEEKVSDAPESAQGNTQEALETLVLALEYVHATLSGHAENTGSAQDEASMQAVQSAAGRLRDVSMRYTLVAAAAMPGSLDEEARTLVMHSMASWTMLRGHRYQALEGEFFAFVLEPHDDALRQAYGCGAVDVARGIQAAVDATRFGHMQAGKLLFDEMQKVQAVADSTGVTMEEAVKSVYPTEEAKKDVQFAVQRLFFGGTCDVGKTSGLPPALLDDLSYARGEEQLFFSDGPLRGTPMRRLPARERPLIRLNGTYYACDPNFLRDSAYRAIQWGLGRRLVGYEKDWGERQAQVTEAAFPRIMAMQLTGATVLESVFYPDPDTGKWVENDLVIVLDDVLLQIEVKAGVMPMHSPEMHFDRHVRTVQSLVVKAKQQSERFFRYAASAQEVPLYALRDGKYLEVHRLRLAKYRLLLPIGLTVEAFTPFSSMSKRLPEMAPILGKHPFMSMSVDDLFVLARFLPTTGAFMHYLSVRQCVAGQLAAALVDELDHLGAYITHNRVDMFNEEHFAQGANLLTHAGASDVVDEFFGDPDWTNNTPPHQQFPPTLTQFLASLDLARDPGFLLADTIVRDMSAEGRGQLAELVEHLLPSLAKHPYRWAWLGGDGGTLVWLQRSGNMDFTSLMVEKAEAAALAMEMASCHVLLIMVGPDGKFLSGRGTEILAPAPTHARYAARLAEGQAMLGRARPPNSFK